MRDFLDNVDDQAGGVASVRTPISEQTINDMDVPDIYKHLIRRTVLKYTAGPGKFKIPIMKNIDI